MDVISNTRRTLLGGALALSAVGAGCKDAANGMARGSAIVSQPIPELLPEYVGPVATRTRLAMMAIPDAHQMMSRTFHFARQDLAGVSVLLGNWFADVRNQAGRNGAELGSGGPALVRAAVEYPEGVITPLTFKGSESGLIDDGAQLLSDEAVVDIPDGARFWVRWWGHFPGPWGVPANPLTPTFAAGGDGFEFGRICADRTRSGVIRQQNATIAAGPLAILGRTTRPSFWLGIDSRCYGQGDEGDSSGDTGELARSLGGAYAYINAGIPAQRLENLVDPSRSANQRALMAYGSHGIFQGGINDLAVGHHSGERLLTDLEAFVGAWGSARPLFACTLSPLASSSDGFVTEQGQNPFAGAAQIKLYNDALRAGAPGLAGVIDIASVTSGGSRADVWKAAENGALTKDGIHANAAGYAWIARSGVVRRSINPPPAA